MANKKQEEIDSVLEALTKLIVKQEKIIKISDETIEIQKELILLDEERARIDARHIKVLTSICLLFMLLGIGCLIALMFSI